METSHGICAEIREQATSLLPALVRLLSAPVHSVSGCAPGRIAVLSPNPAPETVLQSEPDYLGVTGLWALPARPGDAADALLVLSSVSGSRALSTGTQSRHLHIFTHSPNAPMAV